MRVLTVRQPWAWAIVHGGKDVENRSRNLAGEYRGPVAIHAALVPAGESDPVWDLPLYRHAHDSAVAQVRHRVDFRGAIIGVVEVVGAHRALGWNPGEVNQCGAGSACPEYSGLCSPWAEPGAWHLELVRPRPLSEPIPFRGALGLRMLPADVVAAVERAVA